MRKKMILWGTGNVAKKFVRQQEAFLQKIKIQSFTDSDNNKWGTTFYGYAVCNPDVLLRQEYDYILILSSYFKDIKDKLLDQYLVPEEKILSIDEAFQMNAKYANGVCGGEFRLETLDTKYIFRKKCMTECLTV